MFKTTLKLILTIVSYIVIFIVSGGIGLVTMLKVAPNLGIPQIAAAIAVGIASCGFLNAMLDAQEHPVEEVEDIKKATTLRGPIRIPYNK